METLAAVTCLLLATRRVISAGAFLSFVHAGLDVGRGDLPLNPLYHQCLTRIDYISSLPPIIKQNQRPARKVRSAIHQCAKLAYQGLGGPPEPSGEVRVGGIGIVNDGRQE